MIQLFKVGTSHLIDGITCKMCTVNEYNFEHLLEDGWHLDPADVHKEVHVPKELEKPVITINPSKDKKPVILAKAREAVKAVNLKSKVKSIPEKTA
jgi:rRNA processing protein Krr1/Pno1